MTVQPKRLSQTLLGHADRCLQSARLYTKHNGGPSSIPKARGTLLHLCWQRLLTNLIEQDEPTLYALGHTQGKGGEAIPEDEASAKRSVASLTEAIVNEVRGAHPELHVPSSEADAVRAMLFHLAVAQPVDPARVVAIERKFVMDVLGWEVSGKLDVASITGESGEVDDIKSSFFIPGQEEYEHSFQHKCYAALLVYGQPVSKVQCPTCAYEADPACPRCGGSRTVEVRASSMGEQLGWVKCRELYPRYLRDDGQVQQRDRTLTRTEINDFRVDLEALVARVDQALREDEWPAVPGHHCFQCPAASECPLPPSMRGPRGTEEGLPIDVPEITAENAESEAVRWHFLSEQATALRKALRGYAKENEVSIDFGRDLTLEFKKVDKRSVDRDAMKAAAEDAARFGHPFDPEAYVEVKSATEFSKRRLTAAELDARAQEATPTDSHGRAAGARDPAAPVSPPAPGLDERYGAEAPY